jgi:hypothetical protein
MWVRCNDANVRHKDEANLCEHDVKMLAMTYANDNK